MWELNHTWPVRKKDYFYFLVLYKVTVWECEYSTVARTTLGQTCLWLMYSDRKSFYKKILKYDGLISFHHKNIQVLVTEMYKVNNDSLRKIFSCLFCQTEIIPYNHRRQHDFRATFVKTVYHRSENTSYLGFKAWYSPSINKKMLVPSTVLKIYSSISLQTV